MKHWKYCLPKQENSWVTGVAKNVSRTNEAIAGGSFPMVDGDVLSWRRNYRHLLGVH